MRTKIFLLIALLLGTTGLLQAQVNITAQVNKTNLTLDDEITLTVNVSGVKGNIIMPQLPSLPSFNVYSREVEQSSINGAVSLQFRYVMLPRFVGNTTIGPVRFDYEGKTYQTEPISIRIYRQGANTPSTQAKQSSQKSVQHADPSLPPLEASLVNQAYAKSGTPFFLVAAVSNSSPYVNEPFTLAIRFYYSQAFYDAPYQKPTVSNLFMEDENSSEGSQAISDTLYRYTEQRYRLTAAAAGKATIGPASVRYHPGSAARSAFDRFFGTFSEGPERTASSNPISLQILPLPTIGKPDSFYGAVGQNYTIFTTATPLQVPAGEAINLTVTIKGKGNLKATQNLNFPPIEGFKIYPAAATSGTTHGIGYKTFKAVLVPAASGIYTIPTIDWSYFDSQNRVYKTLHSTPLQLTVTPAEKMAGSVDFSTATPVETGVQTLAKDIAYLKTNSWNKDTFLVHVSQLAVLNWVGLFLVIITALFVGLGQKSLTKKKAFLAAKNQLKQATSLQTIAEVLHIYLQQRLHLSTSSLPLKEILINLQKKGVTPATAEAFSLLWQRLEAQRFAPRSTDEKQISSISIHTLSLLKRIEEETK